MKKFVSLICLLSVTSTFAAQMGGDEQYKRLKQQDIPFDNEYDPDHSVLIGSGSFGEVFEAKKKKDESLVAIKKIEATKDTLSRFYQEGVLLENMVHNNILEFKGRELRKAGKGQYVLFLCTERMDCDLGYFMSESQHSYLFKRPDTNPVISKIILFQVLAGLEHIHKQGVVHRDIKANNILIIVHAGPENKEFYKAKIGDFGWARVLTKKEAKNGGLFINRGPVSVPSLCAPECYGTKPYSTKIDIFAVGCLFFNMRTSKPLFETIKKDGKTSWPDQWEHLRIRLSSIPKQYENKELKPAKNELNFISSLLSSNPEFRFTAKQAIDDVYLEPELK